VTMLAETTWAEVAHYAVTCGLVAWFSLVGLLTAVLYVVTSVCQLVGREMAAWEKRDAK